MHPWSFSGSPVAMEGKLKLFFFRAIYWLKSTPQALQNRPLGFEMSGMGIFDGKNSICCELMNVDINTLWLTCSGFSQHGVQTSIELSLYMDIDLHFTVLIWPVLKLMNSQHAYMSHHPSRFKINVL